jgi:hypothetical protein
MHAYSQLSNRISSDQIIVMPAFMIRPFLWLSGLLVLTYCMPPSSGPIAVKGKWKTAAKQSAAYLSLNFADSTAVFDTMADTILRFQYQLNQQNKTLELTDLKHKTVACEILQASADSLVFANLWDLEQVQRFSRE